MLINSLAAIAAASAARLATFGYVAVQLL